MTTLLTFAAVLLIAAFLIHETQRFIRDQRAMREPLDLADPYLAEEVRRALNPDTYAGPTHADPSRDSRDRSALHPLDTNRQRGA